MKRVLGIFCATLLVALTGAACSGGAGGGGQSADASSSILHKVLQSKVLHVGFLADTPPYSQTGKSNDLVGIDPDFAQLMAKDLGVKLKTTVLPNSDARVTALQSHSLDIVFGDFTMTPQRAESVAFSMPYGIEQLVFEGQAGSPNITSLDTDLKGKKVGIVTGSFQENLKNLAPEAKYVEYADFAAPLSALKAGQVDYVLAAPTQCQKDVQQDPSLACLGPAYQDFLCLGVPQGDQIWLNWVNNFIIYHGGDGTLNAIYKKWTGENMPKVLPNF